jgi:hypothetical protein
MHRAACLMHAKTAAKRAPSPRPPHVSGEAGYLSDITRFFSM